VHCRRRVCSVFIELYRHVLQPIATLSVLRLVLSHAALSALDHAPPGHHAVINLRRPVCGWLGSRVVSVLNSGTDRLGSNRRRGAVG